MKKILVLCIIGSILLTGCSANYPAAETESSQQSSQQPSDIRRIDFSKDFLELAGEDVEGFIDYIAEMGEGNYEELDSHSEESVYMLLNQEQETYWEQAIAERLEEEEQELQTVSDKFYAQYSDDHAEIDVYYDMTMTFESAFEYIGDATIYCAMYQVMHGNDEYSINLNIYNADTGKLVTGGNLSEDVSYNNTEWASSYQVTTAEAEKIESNFSDVASYVLSSTFIDAIGVIDIWCTATGNDYSYLFINEAGEVVLGLNAEQKSNSLLKAEEYISDIQTQFREINEGYTIETNEDYSLLEFYFDENLSKQDQSNYVVYTETLSMISQILLKDSNEFYIDINIYDSNSGTLISNGNTTDGIQWNVGEE